MLNLVRAACGIDHFSYVITSYCNSYKVRCCQDVIKYLSQLRVNVTQVTIQLFIHLMKHEYTLQCYTQKQNCKRLFKHVQAVMMTVTEVSLLLTGIITITVMLMHTWKFVALIMIS